MMSRDKKRAPVETSTISTLLGRDINLEGTLTFSETIRVDGRIKGNLVSTKGTVIVGENAIIDADIKVGVAIIRGKVNGRIEASDRIEVYAPAQVNGDISAPTVTIDSGVVFNGKCQMQGAGSAMAKTIQASVDSPKKVPIEDQKVVKNL
jgi:cytoskeletal protein CcmA (bactofilin family)